MVFFFSFLFFFYPSLIFNELCCKSYFVFFTISSLHVPHVSLFRSRFFNNYFYLCFSHSHSHTHTFQYCKSKLYMTLGCGDKTLKRKKKKKLSHKYSTYSTFFKLSFLLSFSFCFKR